MNRNEQGTLLRSLGLVGASFDARRVWALLVLALGLYSLGYLLFYPVGANVDDERLYLDQARALVEWGSFTLEKLDPLTGESVSVRAGDYPTGMVALMAPFVWAFGWRGAFLASFLSLIAAVLVTARWIQEERRSPVFALVLLGFPAALVAGRLAMSDVTRTALAALGLWFFFRGLDGSRRCWWLASGLLAGTSLTVRESAVLPFVPFFAGALLRWDRGWSWLLLGGVAGTTLHLVTNYAFFGSTLFVRGTGAPYPIELATIPERLPLYLLGLLVLVPGGLWFGLSYRGRRRPELVATVSLFFLFYLGQEFGMAASGFVKRLVIALRYFDPLLPVLAFAMAEALPRQLEVLLARRPDRARVERLASAGAALWIAGVLASALAVHPTLGRWGASQASIGATIEHYVPRDTVLVTNGVAVRKFVDDLARPYLTLWRDDVSPADVAKLRDRHGGFWVAFLDRSDSEYWRRDAAKNEAFVAQLEGTAPLADLRVTATDRLRIWRVGEPRRAAMR